MVQRLYSLKTYYIYIVHGDDYPSTKLKTYLT